GILHAEERQSLPIRGARRRPRRPRQLRPLPDHGLQPERKDDPSGQRDSRRGKHPSALRRGAGSATAVHSLDVADLRLERWDPSDGPLSEKRMMILLEQEGYEVAAYTYREATVFPEHTHPQDK